MSSTNVKTIARRQERTEEQDPLRVALGVAIEAEIAASAAVVTAHENLKRGHAVIAAAEAQLESARKLVENARARDVRAMSATIRNKSAGASPDATMTRQARAAVQEKEDLLEVAQGAIARLEQDVVESEAAALWATVDTMAARNTLLLPTCRELIERAGDFRRGLAVCRGLLIELLNDPSRGAPELLDDALGNMRVRERITGELAGLRTEAQNVSMLNATAGEQEAVAASVDELRRAVSNLMTDATTELPPLP
jgi:hypothetical protein